MVQDIEKLGPELGIETLRKPHSFHHRHVQVVETMVTPQAASHRAIATVSRRHQNRTALSEAAQVGE
jgi:hypothetical protein